MVLLALIPLLWLAVAAGVVAMGEAVRRGREDRRASVEGVDDWRFYGEHVDLPDGWTSFVGWPPARPLCEARARRSHADLRRSTRYGRGRSPRAGASGRCQRAKCTCAWARRVG